MANKAGSVPGNITGIFDSSKHQVNLYCENHIQLAMFIFILKGLLNFGVLGQKNGDSEIIFETSFSIII